jgi:hypothetical protein
MSWKPLLDHISEPDLSRAAKKRLIFTRTPIVSTPMRSRVLNIGGTTTTRHTSRALPSSLTAAVGIRIIAASSPQAKGRVERVHCTHQDRLVKKLRLAGVVGYDEANRYLGEHYIAEHNRRYARPAAEAADYHRRRPTARQLDQVFWLEEDRVVSEDWVVRYQNRLLQLERQSQHWAPSRSRVRVRENEAGRIQINYREQSLPFRELQRASTARSEARGAAPSPAPPSPKPSPAKPHPWRQRRFQDMKTPAFSLAW